MIAATLLVAAAIALTGCTSAVKSAETGSSTTPRAGGSIVVAQSEAIQTSAILANRGGNAPWIQNVFQPLISLSSNGTPQPILATSWKFANDGTSMTLEIRKGVTFQTGRKLTADDVKWTLQQSQNPASASQLGFIAQQFTSIDVTGPYSLKIDFAARISQSALFDYFQQTYILDKDTYSGLANGTEVDGTGPYRWGSYVPGTSVTLTRYAGYWGAKPYLNSIKFEVISDETALLDAARGGSAQLVSGMTATDLESFAGNKQFTILNGGGAIYPFGVDVTKAPFNNVKVRQALGYAIDRDRINQQVFAGTGTVTDLPFAPDAPGISKGLENHYTYSPEKAKKLIQEAGAVGAAVPITYDAVPAMQAEYQIVANNLTAIGLKPSANALDATTYNALQVQGKLGPAFLLLHGQVGYQPSTMLDSLPSLRQGNPSQFWTPEYVSLRTKLTDATTASAQASTLAALSSYLLDQAFNLTILQAPGQAVISNSLHGVTATHQGELLFQSAYLAR